MGKSLKKLYEGVRSGKLHGPKPIKTKKFISLSDIYLEEVNKSVISATNIETGREVDLGIASDRLTKTIKRQINAEYLDTPETLKKLLSMGGFRGEGVVKEILYVLNHTQYKEPMDLINELANTPSARFPLINHLNGEEKLIELIKDNLSDTTSLDMIGIDELIKQIYLIEPSGSTNVGPGELVFSIFSKCSKGTSGDLAVKPGVTITQEGGEDYEVEVKASGKAGRGARLGGSAAALRGPVELQALLQENQSIIKSSKQNKIESILDTSYKKWLNDLQEVKNLQLTNPNQAISTYNNIKQENYINWIFKTEVSKDTKLFRYFFSDKDPFDLVTKSGYEPSTRGIPYIDLLINKVSDKIGKPKDIKQDNTIKINTNNYADAYAGFLNMLDYKNPQTADKMYEIAIKGLTTLKTYTLEDLDEKGFDLEEELYDLFGGRNAGLSGLQQIKKYNPMFSKSNFELLVGAVHFACYHAYSHQFDYLLLIRNDNLHYLAFNTQDMKGTNKLKKAYDHLVNNPVTVDVHIDRPGTKTPRGTSAYFVYKG